jgi:hypothetical protein
VVRSANAPVSNPGVSAKATIATVGPAIVSHRTGRHRRDGIRPSGKSRKNGMNSTSVGMIIHRSIHAANRPKGNEPGFRASASVA